MKQLDDIRRNKIVCGFMGHHWQSFLPGTFGTAHIYGCTCLMDYSLPFYNTVQSAGDCARSSQCNVSVLTCVLSTTVDTPAGVPNLKRLFSIVSRMDGSTTITVL